MKCKKCGYENNDNAKFCNECGATLYEKIDDNTKENVEEFHQDINKIIEPDIIHATMEENNQGVEIKGNNNEKNIDYKFKIKKIYTNKKYIIISIVAICIATGIILIGVNYSYSSKVKQADEAMSQQDYDKAVSLYGQALGIFNREDTQSKISKA